MGEGDDSQGDGRIDPGRRWRPCKVQKGGVCKGRPKIHGGLEEQKMPRSRDPAALGEKVEDGLRGSWRSADLTIWGGGLRYLHVVEGGL